MKFSIQGLSEALNRSSYDSFVENIVFTKKENFKQSSEPRYSCVKQYE